MQAASKLCIVRSTWHVGEQVRSGWERRYTVLLTACLRTVLLTTHHLPGAGREHLGRPNPNPTPNPNPNPNPNPHPDPNPNPNPNPKLGQNVSTSAVLNQLVELSPAAALQQCQTHVSYT